MLSNTLIPTALMALASVALAAPTELDSRQSGGASCSPDLGLSAAAGVQLYINQWNSMGGTPFAVNPREHAIAVCDAGNTVCVDVFNARSDAVLQTNLGAIASLAANVLNNCNTNGAIGGYSSSDDGSWSVTVRGTHTICS